MVYAALDSTRKQIRLIHLASASQAEDEITCSFSITSVEEEIGYEALSYVWGDENDRFPIKVEGCSVPITKNLYSALKHLRLENQIRILWIDALCINQSDIREREHQVAFMGLIYSRASLVVVWLGEAWFGSDLAMDLVQQSGQDMNLHFDRSFSQSIAVNGMGLESGDLCDHLIEFFNLPWWKRVWTIQEFVLARRAVLQCGKRLLDGELLSKFMDNLSRHGGSCCRELPTSEIRDRSGLNVSSVIGTIHSLEYARAPRETLNFLLLLARFRQRRSTNPCDRLYGILSLAPSSVARIIQPDYTNSPEHVFEAATIAIANHSGNLEVFSHLFGERNLKLPSFVPDWTGSVPQLSFYLERLGHTMLYKASADIPAGLKLVAKGQVVTRGIILDKVYSTAERFQNMKKLALADGDTEEKYIFTGEPMQIAFWHTMCGSIEKYTKDSSRYSRRLGKLIDISSFERWQAWLVGPSGADPVTPYDEGIGDVNQPISSNTVGRKFAKTKKGYIGLVPRQCEDEDVIVVLAGGPVPYVLRPEVDGALEEEQAGHSHYTVVGDSYIHGIMDGELLKMAEGSEQEWKEIVLL